MPDKVLTIVYYIMYAVGLFWVGDGIFHNRVKEKAKYVVMTGVYLLVTIPAVLFLDTSSFMILALNLLMYMVLFQGNLFSCFVHFVSVYLLINMAESMIYGIGVILFSPLLKQLEFSSIRSGELSLLFSIVITGFILCIVRRKWTQDFIMYFRTLNWFQYLVIAMITWSGILLLGIITVVPEYIEGGKESGMLFGLTIVFMGTAFIGVILLVFSAYGKDYYFQQNKIKEEIIHVQQMYFQNIYDNDREMRKFRHDINSQLRYLELLLADGKTQHALEHLHAIGNHFGELEISQYRTGNELLDVIINQKVQEAKTKGIAVEFEGKMDRPDFMDTYDLCTLFSNMLDNCVDACETIQDEEGVITVAVLTHRNAVLVQFKNPATADMYEAIRHGRTTKTDHKNHGLGMENVRRVVSKNGGEIDYFYNDGKLTVEMYFECHD